MYQHFFGLQELPFELTPNPKYLFLTSQHREALANLRYGLSSPKGITLLLGEAGTGKTTLLRAAVASESCRSVQSVYLTNPTLTRDEFVRMLARGLELGGDAENSKDAFLERLERALIERRDRGQITALVVDEAQSLSEELLEEVRLLANCETTTQKLLPLVLAGQPELGDRLNEYHLRHLKQRIALRCRIGPFTLYQTAAYIAARIRMAGGDPASLFTREAVVLIHEQSRGVPRIISTVCDNALLNGFASGRRVVDSEIVREVSRDFDLEPVVSLRHDTRGAVNDLDPKAADAEQAAEQTGRNKRALLAADGTSRRLVGLADANFKSSPQ
jgi:type II secretory pathway predicted ATPase ExeA